MSGLMTTIVSISIVGAVVLAISWFVKERNWIRLILSLAGIVLFVILLASLFGFPTSITARGDRIEEPYYVVVLYLFVLLGMMAQYLYCHLGRAKGKRSSFDVATFLAPLFLSPLVFAPIFVAFQGVGEGVAGMTTAKFMIFLVAFENGFFWKDFVENRKRKSED